MTLHFDLVEGDVVMEKISDPAFVSEWRRLAKNDETLTWYQEHPFVSVWYEAYRSRFTPLFALLRDAENSLVALMALALRRDDNAIVHAGDNHAHYNGWLATPEVEAEFVRKTIDAVFDRTRQRRFRLKFLPPGKTLDGFFDGSTPTVREGRQTIHQNPVWSLVADERPKHKNLRRLLKRYKKLGAFSLGPAESTDEADELLEIMALWDDLRVGAVHSDLPFSDDPSKLQFLKSLVNTEPGVQVYAMRFEGRILAVNVIALDGKERCLGLSFGGDPREARSSPTLLALLELAEKFDGTGVKEYDLIPGGEPWKERFATEHRPLAEVEFFIDAAEARRARRSDTLREVAKSAIVRTGHDPAAVRTSYTRIRHRLSEIRGKVWQTGGAPAPLLYRWTPTSVTETQGNGNHMRVALEDLLSYDRGHHRSETREFFSQALELLRDGWSPLTVGSERGLALSLWYQSSASAKDADDFGDVGDDHLLVRVTHAEPTVGGEEIARLLDHAAREARAAGADSLLILVSPSLDPVVRWCESNAQAIGETP